MTANVLKCAAQTIKIRSNDGILLKKINFRCFKSHQTDVHSCRCYTQFLIKYIYTHLIFPPVAQCLFLSVWLKRVLLHFQQSITCHILTISKAALRDYNLLSRKNEIRGRSSFTVCVSCDSTLVHSTHII